LFWRFSYILIYALEAPVLTLIFAAMIWRMRFRSFPPGARASGRRRGWIKAYGHPGLVA